MGRKQPQGLQTQSPTAGRERHDLNGSCWRHGWSCSWCVRA